MASRAAPAGAPAALPAPASAVASVNLLPRDDAEARLMADVLGTRWFAGVVVKAMTDADAEARARHWTALGYQVSVGMGDGDDGQWRRALDVATAARSAHLNQPWFSAPAAVERFRALGQDTLVNAMVSPAGGDFGAVRLLPDGPWLTLPWPRLAEGLTYWRVWSVKFFPLRGEEGRASYGRLTAALASAGGPRVVEPSGGVLAQHLPWLLEEAAQRGLVAVPHLYGAVRLPDGALSHASLQEIARHLMAVPT